mmetsp:Transcript_29742/g.65820  ORF Transcript_29742/g.65820 Transcript_29742/m.65820 type:complete len:669 (+) Transcript_29742:133-2139(+)
MGTHNKDGDLESPLLVAADSGPNRDQAPVQHETSSRPRHARCLCLSAAVLLPLATLLLGGLLLGPVTLHGTGRSPCTRDPPSPAPCSPTLHATPQPDADYRGRPRRVVSKGGGVVAADQGRCSDVGAQILDLGGNAIDAAVAAALCQGVLNPFASGLGGGDFLLIRLANGTSVFINSRETASAAATADMFDGKPYASLDGGAAIAVPMQLQGLELAWRRYGKLPWSKLVEPAAALARTGFPAHPYLLYVLSGSFTMKRALGSPLMRRALFVEEGGTWRLPLEGEHCCVRPQLAETLSQVALHGASWLLDPERAKTMAAEIQEAGGIITAEDLMQAQPRVEQPLSYKVGEYELLVPGPPSSGAALALALNILAGLNSSGQADRALLQHHLVESMKHAFALRSAFGDPGSADHPYADVSDVLGDTQNTSFVEELRRLIRDDHVLDPAAYGGRWNPQRRGGGVLSDHGTSHLSVVDAQGNAVAATMTINTALGSNVVSASTGIIFNNEMDDFSRPGELLGARGQVPGATAPNLIQPGKRPLSSMCPTIVLKGGALHMVLGASGGTHIVTAVLQVLQRVLLLGQDPMPAVQAPRLHHQLRPDRLDYESYSLFNISLHVEQQLLQALQDKGNTLHPFPDQLGAVQLVRVDQGSGQLIGVSDPRKDGAPAMTRM